MSDKKEVIFGDKATFAIRYAPHQIYRKGSHPDEGFVMAYLHLILGNQLIGEKNESCCVGTWMCMMDSTLNQLEHNFHRMKHPEFSNFTRDDEILELIMKPNRLEEEYLPQYDYLPVLPEYIWNACSLYIDETTDAWIIKMTAHQDQIKFIWKGWRNPCPAYRIGKVYSVIAERDAVIDTIKACYGYVANDIKNYNDYESLNLAARNSFDWYRRNYWKQP